MSDTFEELKRAEKALDRASDNFQKSEAHKVLMNALKASEKMKEEAQSVARATPECEAWDDALEEYLRCLGKWTGVKDGGR